MGESDVWSEWLLRDRHAEDEDYAAYVRADVERFAERVLTGAGLAEGMVLADVGSGEGLIAFRAIERVGPSLRVILTDVSAPMLKYASVQAESRGVAGQCSFVECVADKLVGIDDGVVDVVTTRAVLAYVADKRAALGEFFRVLKPGGRISLAEPIFQDEAYFVRALRLQVDAQGPDGPDRFLPLLHRWKSAQLPDSDEGRLANPLVNYSERDLVNFANVCGFREVHLELHIDVRPSPVKSWDVFLDIAPNPWAPSLRKILDERFSSSEREFFENAYRPIVESGASSTTDRIAYLTARKPVTESRVRS